MKERDNNNSNLQSDKDNEIILYQPDSTLSLDVRVENDTIWLNRNQIALLFDRDVKTIGKHINNALKEELPVFQLSQNLRQFKLRETAG